MRVLSGFYSFLKWGDELYLGDDSNDGTETILDTIKLSNKIKLFKIKWPSDSKLIAKGGVIAHVHNELLKNVKLHNKDAMVFYFLMRLNIKQFIYCLLNLNRIC